MSADGWIIPLARLPLHKTGSNNKNPVITRFLEGQLGPRTRFHSSAQTDSHERFPSAANVLHSWLRMFRAAKDTSWALRVTPGLQALGPLFVRGGSVAFSVGERYLKVLASTESADEPKHTPGGHAHPDILTGLRGLRGLRPATRRFTVTGQESGVMGQDGPRCERPGAPFSSSQVQHEDIHPVT